MKEVTLNDTPELIGVPPPEWSVASRIKPLPRPLTHQEMARFEAAIDILNSHVGLCVALVRSEVAKPDPNDAVVAALKERQRGYIALRNSLKAMDFDTISQVLNEARAVTEELNSTTESTI